MIYIHLQPLRLSLPSPNRWQGYYGVGNVLFLCEHRTNQIHSFKALIFPERNDVYQQDNVLYHKGRVAMEWFKEHSGINPIQHLWSHLQNQICTGTLPPRNVRELQHQLVSTWYQIPQTTYQYLVKLMERQMLAVLRAKGCAINKWSSCKGSYLIFFFVFSNCSLKWTSITSPAAP